MSPVDGFDQPSPQVFAARGPVVTIGDATIDDLVTAAAASPTGRARLLLHRGTDDALHEMVIALPQTSCDRPHMNFKSGKSFHVLRGAMAVLLFSDDGRERSVVRLAADRKDPFIIRLSEPRWHTIIPLSDPVVFVETITGPFTGNRFADWSPTDMDTPEGRAFGDALRTLARRPERV